MSDGTIMCLDVELDRAIRQFMGIESGPVDKTAFIERLDISARQIEYLERPAEQTIEA